MSPRLIYTFLNLVLVAAALGQDQTAQSSNPQTLYYIPHTHWEGAVFKTREEYLEMGLPNILKALSLLKRYPEYKFTLDQVAYVRPFLERYPEEAEAFRQFVREGRLGIVGGMDVMPDNVKPGGELFVRQMQYGKKYCREQLGVDVTVGWLLDTFGHHAQMPQLLRLAGYNSFWFCRGVPQNRLPSEFRWRGLDGTEIPAFWLPGFYGLFYGPPRQLPEFTQFFKSRFESLNRHAGGAERVGLAGVDVSEPEEYVPPLVDAFNRQADKPFTIRYAVPLDFEAVVARRSQSMVLSGDFNPIFQGTYSSRIELKQLTKGIETRLLTAEKLRALATVLGLPAQKENLWRAWEPVLFNQTHDLASGVMTDHVYEDTLASYQFSSRLADQSIEEQWATISARIDTRGEGTAVAVFNPLSWVRTDAAEVEVGFAASGVKAVQLSDPLGNEVPVQWVSSDRYPDGGLKRGRLAFVARDVPSLGYSTYRLKPSSTAEAQQEEAAGGGGEKKNVLENEQLRVTFDSGSGAIAGLYDKAANWEVLSGPGNVVARQTDHGDLWELYRGLDGASHIAMTNRQSLPAGPDVRFSNQFPGTNGVVKRGPVFSEFTVSHPFDSGSFATRVRLYSGLPRLEIETRLVNREKYVRYQALFPTSIQQGRQIQTIPFGALERAEGIEFPAQEWVDYGDNQHGLGLLNCGLPGNLVTEGTLLLSLMRSHNLGAYGFGGGYEPGMSSETGFQLNKPIEFRYALLPHRGDWRAAKLHRAGLEFNHPFLVRKLGSHEGTLPRQWGLAEISPSNVVLTSLTPSDRGVNMRFYEATGEATPDVKIRLNGKVASASVVNLLGDAQQQLTVQDNSIQVELRPFEIKTVELVLP